VVRDRDTGLSRGFGFVRYRDKAHAEFAIKAVNNREYVVILMHAQDLTAQI
jgi:RNA recognition motif-containing protein